MLAGTVPLIGQKVEDNPIAKVPLVRHASVISIMSLRVKNWQNSIT
jgi:hypothetical protein